ncbi:MAG: hypothetical protein GWN11_00530 [Candidatus Dadabacteria bacterium]|nr:hypothetical protein [Candidatus Dadabacteria bacterium]
MIFYKKFFISLITILTVSFFSIGGCDIDFSTDDSGGGGISDMESMSGQIIDIIPSVSLEGLTVEITNTEDVTSQGTTDSSGNFFFEGDFNAIPEVVTFLDTDDVSLGNFSVNIFPGADVDLGDIRIDNGTVTLDFDVMVIFFGDITAINCVDNDGSIDVEVDNVDVTVEIDGSTDLERESDNDNITCADLILGQEVRVDGDMPNPTGNIVEASEVQVQD